MVKEKLDKQEQTETKTKEHTQAHKGTKTEPKKPKCRRATRWKREVENEIGQLKRKLTKHKWKPKPKQNANGGVKPRKQDSRNDLKKKEQQKGKVKIEAYIKKI